MSILKAHKTLSGVPITLYLSTNFAVTTVNGTTLIVDGVHNNGGWEVKETQQEIEFAVEQWLAELQEF